MWFWGSAGFASGAFKDAVSHHGSSKQDFFTEGHLQDLFDALHAFDTIDDRNRDAAVEILRQIAELLVWGERHKNEAFFDIFCEQNILSYFVDIVSQPRVANAVKVQLLQTLSILVQNTHRKTAIYYLFSNNYINTLLRTPYDFSNEELVAWYVSFIKGLSLLVNHDTVKLFLNKRAPSFPVFSEAVKFFVHRDSMVRTHVRTVTLSIFKIREPVVEEFLVRHSAFFSHIACYLRAQWAERCRGLRACRRLSPRYHASTTTSTSSRSAASASPCGRDTPGTAACVAALKSGFSECEEFLFYIQDIFGIGVEAYNTLLVERLLLYTYLPLLVGCLCRGAPRETTVRRFAFPDAEPTSTVSTPGGGDWGRSGTQGPSSLARRLTRDTPSSASSSRNFRRRSREVLSSPMSVPLGSFPSSQRPSMPPSSSAPLSQTLSPATSRSRPRRKYPCPAPSQAFSPASFSPSHSSSYSSSPCSPLSSSPSSSAASLPSLPASSVAPSLSPSASFLSKRGERGDRRSSPDALRPRHRWRSKSVGRQATPADAGEFLLASSNRGNAGDLLYTRGGRAVLRAQAERDQSSPRRGEARGETEPSEEESDKAEARRGELGKKAHGRRGRRHDAGEQEGEGDASPERRGVADVPPKRRPRRLRGPAELELVMTPLTGQTSRRGTAEEDPTTETEASREEPAEREAETHAKKGNARRLSRSRAKTETPGFVQKRDAKPGSEEAVASERTRHVEWRRRRERERGSLRDSGKREARGASVPVSFASCASTDDACEGPQTADDTPQVVALYLLIQSFTTIQHPDLLRPVLALLLLPRVPESLLRLCAAHLPPTPASYVALESPAQCAGRVELFLPDESADAAGAVEDENEAASRWRGCKPPQGGGEAGRERRNSAVIRADGEMPQARGLKRELGSGASATTTANRPTGRAEGDPLRSRERETLVNGREEKETEGKREERRDEENNEGGGEKNLTPTLTDAEHEEFEGSTLSRSACASRPPLFASFSFERGGRSPAERASKEADSRRLGDARKRFSLSTGRTKEAASSSLPARASKIENAFVNASTASKAFRCTRASSGVSITGGVSTTGGVSALEASGEKGRTRDGEETSFLKRHDGHRGLQCGGFCSSGTEQEEGITSFPSAAQRDFGTCPSLSASAVLATRRPLLQKAQKEIQRAFEENLFFSLCSEDVSSPISRCQSRSESHARQTVSAVWGGLGEGAGDGERGSAGCREGDSEGREEQPRRSGHWASEMGAEGRRPSWGSSRDSFPEEDEDTVWVTNPYRRALEYFVGAEAASRRRRDTAVLLGGALLHAVLSHPTVTSVFLQNAGLLPSLRPARGRRAPRFRRSMSPESSYGDRVLASASCVPLSAFASAASSSFTAPSPRPASSSSLTSSSSAPPFSTLHARLSSFVSLPSRAEMETEERESPRGADADSAGKGTPTAEAGALEEKGRLEDPKTTKKDAEEPQAAGREARGNKQREERREEEDASELQEEARTPRAQDWRKTAEGSEEEDAKETRLRACGKCRDDRTDSRPGNQFRIACRWSLLKTLLDAVQQNAHETFMRPVTVTLVCRVASLCVLSVLGRLGVSSLSPVVSSTRVSGSGEVGTRRKRFLLLRLLDEGLRRLSCKVKDLRKAATASVQLALMDADTHAHADGGFANPDNSHCPVALFWEEWESVKNAPPFDSGALSRDARMLLPAAVAGMSSQGGSGASEKRNEDEELLKKREAMRSPPDTRTDTRSSENHGIWIGTFVGTQGGLSLSIFASIRLHLLPPMLHASMQR
ncbi:putative CLEC16A [Toxoplasma gondii TgCatPRC2]|uniref:Putative CLEC16A n=1 Tax=Toxoplasma gondii TgCatPRC2 TaxID=1130821 RepID=A0A151H7W1_TOXGO|nr:putative CLEC16A [Toxoplasma gondii TgCatPRC2]